MATQYRTPGVYITEQGAFPLSIVGVETAVPCFIGYTGTAIEINGGDLRCIPRRIESLAEYEQLFGKGHGSRFYLTADPLPAGDTDWGPAQLGLTGCRLAEIAGTRFNLYDSIRLFYANGGGSCYIVSCGSYGGAVPPPPIEARALHAGLDAAQAQAGPTMTVIPDLVLLADPADSAALAVAMLDAAAQTQDRMALLDIWGVDLDPKHDWSGTIAAFRAALAAADPAALRYGAAYFPPLITSLTPPGAVGIDALSTIPAHLATLQQALRESLAGAFPGPAGGLDARGEAIDSAWIARLGTLGPDEGAECARVLSNALPGFAHLREAIARARSVLPPSGAMAGIWSATDATLGVWKAPANTGVATLIQPALPITDAQQADLNAPADGLAINAIRSFPGRGPLVWGARTLDANSGDWRYINMRRTVIYIEQSIKNALLQLVFEPNAAATWATATAMIENFLHRVWAAGGLMGSKPSDAYQVQCGLGATMTADDVLNGRMQGMVTLALTRPAEFIVLSFTQQMAQSG